MFNNFKYKCFNKRVAKHAATQVRKRVVHNLSTAKRIGIVAQVSDEKTLLEVLEIKHTLDQMGAKTHVLIYFPNKEIPNSFLMRKDVDIIDCKTLNWLKIPISPVVDTFVKTDFDVLIDLSYDEILPVRWITSTSKSDFIVGINNYPGNPFDLIVSVKLKNSYKSIFSDIKMVLQTIKQ